MNVDLTSHYLGLKLDNPLTVSACPLTGNVQSLIKLREAGAAAAVLPSIFEEQIEHDEAEIARLLDIWTLSSPESSGYFPELDTYNTGPDAYLELIADAKRELDMPIIASLNGATLGGWIRYAGRIEKAGADALELNVYRVPDSPELSSSEVDREYVQLVRSIKQEINIPVTIKIGPYFSSLPYLAKELELAGADGLVLFNRYLAPDIDLEARRFTPALELSTAAELRVALRWLAILRDQIKFSLAATGGVHAGTDVVKAMMVGADVVSIASVLLEHGNGMIPQLLQELTHWMHEHDYESVNQLRGCMSKQHCPNPEGLQRANYMRALTSYTARS